MPGRHACALRSAVDPACRDQLARITGRGVLTAQPLAGGCIAEVYRVRLDGPGGERSVVVKVDRRGDPGLEPEGFMLRFLAATKTIPVPGVLHCDEGLLVMQDMPGRQGPDAAAERHAAELLAALHAHTAPAFGFERDTVIGSLRQPNPWTASWVEFFVRHRLLHFGEDAARAARLPATTMKRLERLTARLGGFLEEPEQPALVHGDVWSGNVLAEPGRITAFLDPAIHYAHPEVELAFIGLFRCFGDAFYRRYDELRGIRPGFFETRRDIYNLYPLLVHARLFGGGYAGDVEQIVRRFE